MTDREKFLERWAWTGIRARDVQYCEDYEGCAVAVRHNPQSGIGFEDTRSLTPRMAWDRTDDAMVAHFGEPPSPARDALVLEADAAMRKWQARAKEVDLPRWTIDLMGLLCSWRATVLDADVEVYADTWPEAVLQCDALAEPIWQARESK